MIKTTGATKLLVVLGVMAGGGHVVYPAALGVAARRRSGAARALAPETGVLPPVTVLVPAFRELGTIRAKIDDLRRNGYPGELRIIVVAEDLETSEAARMDGIHVITPAERLGKSGALNVGIGASDTEVVIITDANNRLVEGSLAALVRGFDEPSVGAVTGDKTEDEQGEALYWRFESWLKQRESELGSTLGIVGELFAIRRDVWCPIPADIAIDDLWIALDLAERGHAVRFEPAARSIEPAIPAAQQWERRTRNVAGVLHVISRKRHLLAPRRGLVAAEIAGHKLWRSSVGPVCHVLLIGVAVGARRSNRLARLVLVVHGSGAVAALAAERGARLPRPLALLRQVLYLQAVAIGGLVRFVRGQTSPTWQKAQR